MLFKVAADHTAEHVIFPRSFSGQLFTCVSGLLYPVQVLTMDLCAKIDN